MSPALTQPRPPQIHEYEHLGTYLRDLRRYYNLQVNDVAQRIHIRAKYIQAMEDQKPELLPGKVYARGYIATYAEFLGLEPESFAERYLGQEVKPVAESRFFVPEPKRKQFERKAVKRPPYWAFACVGLLAGAYMVLPTASDEVPVAEVTEVPEYLAGRLRNGLMPMPGNMACLLSGRGMACVTPRLQQTVAALPPAALPRQWRRASDVVRDEKAAKAAREKLQQALPEMVQPDAKPDVPDVNAVPLPKATPAASKPAPTPVKPAPKPKPKPKTDVKKPAPSALPTGDVSVPTAAAKPLPWMTPEAAAGIAPAAKGAAKPASHKAKHAEGAEEHSSSYRDPNAMDEWFPRRARR